jgi:hypothetical protein
MRTAQRSHRIVSNGGDQPNVGPSNASVWYYFRELDYEHILDLHAIGDSMAQGAALMTHTTVTSRLLGAAWPGHFNKAIALATYENIKKVGLPQWTEDDQKLAKALQGELHVPMAGLSLAPKPLRGPAEEKVRRGDGREADGFRRAPGERYASHRRRRRLNARAVITRPRRNVGFGGTQRSQGEDGVPISEAFGFSAKGGAFAEWTSRSRL